jgi:hypothetical protein
MLRLPLIEIILRLIPEALILIFAAHAFTKTTINKKRYFLSCILLGGITYLIRSLPIEYGIHSVLGFILFVTLLTSINKINIIKSIRAVFISVIIMFFSEGINVLIIQFVLNKNIDTLFKDPLLKTLYGIPSLVIFLGIVLAYYFRILKRKKLNYV